MGPKFTQLQKQQPKMMEMVYSDIRLLNLVGAKSTILGEGYTQRYDHAPIPTEALTELAKHVKMEDL